VLLSRRCLKADLKSWRNQPIYSSKKELKGREKEARLPAARGVWGVVGTTGPKGGILALPTGNSTGGREEGKKTAMLPEWNGFFFVDVRDGNAGNRLESREKVRVPIDSDGESFPGRDRSNVYYRVHRILEEGLIPEVKKKRRGRKTLIKEKT